MNDRYFGSDLNKFIHENCRKDMTVNNIDLIMMRYNVKYADNKPVLRVVESKHEKEKQMSKSQKDVHLALAKALRKGPEDIKYEHFIVRGSPPYEQVKIMNVLSGNTYFVGTTELINFLNFEKELE